MQASIRTETQLPYSTAIMMQATMPDSMLGSIATVSSNKKAEQTTPKMIDTSASEVGNKPIFPITKNLVAPSFPRRLVKARKRQSRIFLKTFGRLKLILHCWMQSSKLYDMQNFSRKCAPTKGS